MRHALKHIIFLFTIYWTGILFFTGFRLLLLLNNLDQLANLPNPAALICRAFLMGFRFDTVVSGYILALPLLLLMIASFLARGRKWLYRAVAAFLTAAYASAFFASSADVPYFKQFFSRLTVGILAWMNTPGFVVKMIFGERSYLIYFFVFLLSSTLMGYGVSRLRKKMLDPIAVQERQVARKYVFPNVLISLLACLVLFIGIRGRVAWKSPIRAGTAYFSNYAFPNQLGLNPVYTFTRSWLDARNPANRALHLMDDEKALRNVKCYLNVPPDSGFQSPIARRVGGAGEPRRANVVLVIMESMSAGKMGRYGNPDHLTPVLDSLANLSYCFDRFYSDGTHTYNGIYATLFSCPVLLQRHPMKGTIIPQLTGFAKTLAAHGYQTIFFTTHDEQFDNMAGFLRANEFHYVISQKDYPSDKILSTLGVSDDYLYEFAITRLNDLYEQKRPFLAALLTASDHKPYIIPAGIPFRPHSQEASKRIVEYADWAIGKLLRLAEEQAWYDNSIFVFLADHGAVLGESEYDMPLSYFHSPLIIFAPQILPEARSFDQLAGQIDVFPTVMGLLNMSYVNNTLGTDLLKERRPCIFFTADDKIGCLNEEFFFVHRDNGIESLYQYARGDPTNHLSEYPIIADSLRTYAFSMLQAAQWVIEHKVAGVQNVSSKN